MENKKGEKKRWSAPPDYVPLKTKIQMMMQSGFQPPDDWVCDRNGDWMPPKTTLRAVAMWPAAMPGTAPAVTDVDHDCPRGNAYYTVVIVNLNPKSKVALKTKANLVVFCKEQLLNMFEYEGEIHGWPSGAVSVIIGDNNEDEGEVAPAGVWRAAEEEEATTADGTTEIDEDEDEDESEQGTDGAAKGPMQVD